MDSMMQSRNQAGAWSKDGKTLVTGSRDGSARLLDAATLKVLHELKGHTDAARYAAFSPAGKYVATASFDGSVKIWTVATGKLVTTLPRSEASPEVLGPWMTGATSGGARVH